MARRSKRIEEVLEQVELTDRADDKVEAYSGGMKRRINIAVGLLHKPKLLFMDEPTVGIDPQNRRRILDMVSDLVRSGHDSALHDTLHGGSGRAFRSCRHH